MLSKLRLPEMLHRSIARNTLSIVTYHAVIASPLPLFDWCFLDVSSFRKQIMYLRTHFNVVPFSKAIELVENGKIDKPTAVITFDDGFQNNYDIAFPILREAEIPATIFLSTKFVDTDDTIWFCRLNRAFGKTRKPYLDWNGCAFYIGDPKNKADASARIQSRLKEMPHPRLLKEVRKIISELGDHPDYPIKADSPYRMLGTDPIMEMVQSGLVEFGAHTHRHTILSNLSLEDKQKELVLSIRRVKELTRKPCELFAYPNGRAEDYDSETITLLASFGIRAAATTIPGPNSTSTPLMQLRRYGIGEDIDLAKFQAMVHHFNWRFKKILKIGGSG